MTAPAPTIDTSDIDAKFAEIDARLADHDARIAALEAGGTPTPEPPDPAEREVGVTEPTAANTGLNGSVGGTRSAHTGDLICQAGQTYEDIDVHKGHVVLAPGCVVRRVTATGRLSGGTYYSAIFWGSNAEGALVEDCVARPSKETARVSLNGFGWSGTGYTARWNDVSGVTDLAHGTGDDMTFEGNYCHDYSFWSVDPDQGGGWCHPDGIQVLGGNRVRIVGNSFVMNYDEELSEGVEELLAHPNYGQAWGGGFGNAITLTLNNPVKDWKVVDNWVRGGEVGLQMPKKSKGHDTGNDGEISGNRMSIATANVWNGGTAVHHFRTDQDTGNVVNNKPNVYLDTTERPTATPPQIAAGDTIPGAYGMRVKVWTYYA